MRIAGVNIPSEKRLIIALRYVYGVGPKMAADLIKKVGISGDIRVKNLSSDQEQQLRDALADMGILLESDLRREVSQNVKRLQDIGSYRGFRHRRRLPSRGQRTKTNARTRRGRRGAAVAKKK